MRNLGLEIGLAGELPETGAVQRSFPDARVGEPINLLQKPNADSEARFGAGTTLRRKAVRHLFVDPGPADPGPADPGPIDPIGQPDQLVLQVDDLIEPDPEQVVRAVRLSLETNEN